jgi:SAM-dependent methyltransferase
MGDNQAPKGTPNYAVRGLNPGRLSAIEKHAGRSVLDVGCGSGAYVLQLTGRYDIRGVDYQRFDAWAQRPDLFEVSDAHSLAQPDGAVDTILSFETLEHLPEPARALREYRRVARRNVILTVPNCRLSEGMRGSGVIYNHWIDRTHVNFWDLDTISKEVAAAGFEVKVRDYINHINLGVVMMEALGLSGSAARTGASLFRRLQRREYPMTCLIVAEPHGSN